MIIIDFWNKIAFKYAVEFIQIQLTSLNEIEKLVLLLHMLHYYFYLCKYVLQYVWINTVNFARILFFILLALYQEEREGGEGGLLMT